MLSNLLARLRRTDTFVLECTPLHTERPEWAKQAPAQALAAFRRGAHVVGFSEVHGDVAKQIAFVAAAHGYTFYGDPDTAMAVRKDVTVRHHGHVVVEGRRGYSFVDVEFKGNEITVVNQHWDTNTPAHWHTRNAQTRALIAEVKGAAAGKRLAFFMGDANPTGPQSNPATQPHAALAAAGLVTVNEELHLFPRHLGVTTIGRYKGDTRVRPVKFEQHPAEGSDHIPGSATYRIRRVRAKA